MMSLRRGGKPKPIKEGEDCREGEVTFKKKSLKCPGGMFQSCSTASKAFETDNRGCGGAEELRRKREKRCWLLKNNK